MRNLMTEVLTLETSRQSDSPSTNSSALRPGRIRPSLRMGSGWRASSGADQRCPDRRGRAGVLHRRGHRGGEGRVRVALSLAGQFRRSVREVERGAAGLAPGRRLLALASVFAIDPGWHCFGAAFAERQHSLHTPGHRGNFHCLPAKLPRGRGPCTRARFAYRRRASRRAVGRRRASSGHRGPDRRGSGPGQSAGPAIARGGNGYCRIRALPAQSARCAGPQVRRAKSWRRGDLCAMSR